jgi:hypothetical protein
VDSCTGREAIAIQRPVLSDKRRILIEGMKTLREEADHVVYNFLTKCTSQRALSFANVLSNAIFPTRSLSEKDVTDILFLGTPLSAQLGKELPKSYAN